MGICWVSIPWGLEGMKAAHLPPLVRDTVPACGGLLPLFRTAKGRA